MNKTGIPYLDAVWNPAGYGCSNIHGCPGCWAHQQATCGGPTSPTCPDCAAFRVHFHPERLNQLTPRQKPKVVGVNFLADTFDPMRNFIAWQRTREAMRSAPQHNYVIFTKQAENCADMLAGETLPDNWYLGLTIRNQADYDAKAATFFTIRGNLFFSLEPLWGAADLSFGDNMTPDEDSGVGCTPCDVGGIRHQHGLAEPCGRRIKGVIVGHDNRRGAPGTDTLEHVRSVVEQCREAGVRCYCKQAWVVNETSGNTFLAKEVNQLPYDLRVRNLPWSMPNGKDSR